MKHKFLALFLSIVAALCLAFGVAACGDNSDDGQTDDGNTPEEGNTPDDGDVVAGTEGLEYTLLPGGESYALTGLGTAQGPEITIASHYNGKPVTQIGLYNFTEYKDMQEKFGQMTEAEIVNECGIFAGESYKNNIDDSFKPTTIVSKVNIPDTVTVIGCFSFAFSDVESIEISGSVTTVSAFAFQYCLNLKTVTICNGVTTIGDGAFSYSDSLESITIPDSVTYIGDGAFAGCSGLTIYCEAASQPEGWNSSWTTWDSTIPVIWDYKNNEINS